MGFKSDRSCDDWDNFNGNGLRLLTHGVSMGKNDVHLVYLVELLRALLIMWRLLGRVAL